MCTYVCMIVYVSVSLTLKCKLSVLKFMQSSSSNNYNNGHFVKSFILASTFFYLVDHHFELMSSVVVHWWWWWCDVSPLLLLLHFFVYSAPWRFTLLQAAPASSFVCLRFLVATIQVSLILVNDHLPLPALRFHFSSLVGWLVCLFVSCCCAILLCLQLLCNYERLWRSGWWLLAWLLNIHTHMHTYLLSIDENYKGF